MFASVIVLIFFLIAVSGYTVPPVGSPPTCITNDSEIAFNKQGYVSAQYTFYNCLANVDSPDLISTFYNGQINGILRIDAVAGTMTLDFYLRLYWYDNRLDMPLFWSKTSKDVQRKGIDVSNMLTNDSVFLWMPDIQFNDALEVNILTNKLRLNASNYMAWSRHMTGTFVQSKWKFDAYPNDVQTLEIRAGSYSYSGKYLQLGFISNDPKFQETALYYTYDSTNTYTFKNNPLWRWVSSQAIQYPSTTDYSFVLYNVNMQRQGMGIIVRLILPITLLLILAGLTFWAQYENRVDSTVTLLLAVSALYIVILGNIPMLGYLTDVDKYVFVMFLLLIIVVTAHQTYATLTEKVDRWPLRTLYLRLIEFAGRSFVFPIVLCYYLFQINDPVSATRDYMMAIGLVACTVIIYRESFGVRQGYNTAMKQLLEKVNNPAVTVKEISIVEIIMLNLYLFKTFSTDIVKISESLHREGSIDNPKAVGLGLRNVFTMKESLGDLTATMDKKQRRKTINFHNSHATTQEAQLDGDILMSTFRERAESVHFDTINPMNSGGGSGSDGNGGAYYDAENPPLPADTATKNTNSTDDGTAARRVSSRKSVFFNDRKSIVEMNNNGSVNNGNDNVNSGNGNGNSNTTRRSVSFGDENNLPVATRNSVTSVTNGTAPISLFRVRGSSVGFYNDRKSIILNNNNNTTNNNITNSNNTGSIQNGSGITEDNNITNRSSIGSFRRSIDQIYDSDDEEE